MDTKAIGDLEMLVVNNMSNGLVKSRIVEFTDGRTVEAFVSHYKGSFSGPPTLTITPFVGGETETLRWSKVRQVEAHLSKGAAQTFVINP